MNTRLMAELVKYLNDATSSERVEVMDHLLNNLRFCWHCGCDLDKYETCHCTNDE